MNTRWYSKFLTGLGISLILLVIMGTSAKAATGDTTRVLVTSDGPLNASTSARGALDLRGWNVTLDSTGGPVLTRDAPTSAALNADTWSALSNNGLNGIVYALAVSGSDLYVGGNFTQTADGTVTNLNGIAKYSGGAWSALSNNGLNDTVYALAVMGNDLYVGGNFTQSADGIVPNLNGIAKYSGGAWSALANNGLSKRVYALAVMGNDLYVGGNFLFTYDYSVELNCIAKYSGGVWSAVTNNGLSNSVFALAVSGSDLYVGGIFHQTKDGTVTDLNFIAKYNGGTTWSALANQGLNNVVSALAVSGNDLYVGGYFTQSADGAVPNLNGIAKYSSGAWSALTNNGVNGSVLALAVSGSDLYVGGIFHQTKDGTVTDLNFIAKYNGGTTWSALANQGLNNVVSALAVNASDLYVGGYFTQSADGTVKNLNYIAKFASSAPGYNVYLPLVIR